MQSQIFKKRPGEITPRLERALQVSLALILVAILLPLPRAWMPVNHPYKIELLLSIFLLVVLTLVVRGKSASFAIRGERVVRTIGGAFVVFAAWSGISAFWSQSPLSAVQHSLVWMLFVSFLVIFCLMAEKGVSFFSSTFIIVSLFIGTLSVFDYLSIPDFAAVEDIYRVRYAKSAELLVTLSPVLWAAALYTRRHRKLLYLAAVLSWFTAMLSLSKGAFIAGLAGFAIFFAGSALFAAARFRRRLALATVAWLGLTVGTQLFFSFASALPSTTDYVTGTADPNRTSSTVRVFVWKMAAQMAIDHPLTGVGANNFAINLNHARATYRRTNPSDLNPEIAEDFLLERAHNEPLQVLAELGIVGLILFVLPFAAVAFFFLCSLQLGRMSPMLIGAAGGVAAFAVSSLFSSFAFRSVQNGVVFFMVLAILITQLEKKRAVRKPRRESPRSIRGFTRVSYACGVLLLGLCVTKAVAEWSVYKAEHAASYSDAVSYFQTSLAADPEYAGAYALYANRASAEGDPALAARMTQRAIDNGIGPAITYSLLAQRWEESGEPDSAVKAFRDGLEVYPRSVFLRIELAAYLAKIGRENDAHAEMSIARSVSKRDANTWQLLVTEGSTKAFYTARNDTAYAPLVDLYPQKAVVKYLDELDTIADFRTTP